MTAQFTATVEMVSGALMYGLTKNHFVMETRSIDIDDLVGIILDVEKNPTRRTQILEATKMLLQKEGIEILDSETDPTGERSRT